MVENPDNLSWFNWLVLIYLTIGMIGIGTWFGRQKSLKNYKGAYQIGAFVVYIYIIFNLGY